jgi:hypothetical protein
LKHSEIVLLRKPESVQYIMLLLLLLLLRTAKL